MTQTSRLVIELDSRDAEQKATDVRKALGALEDAGLSIKPAMDKASDGLDKLTDSGKGAEASAGRTGKAWSEAVGGISRDTQLIVKELQALNTKQDATAKAMELVGRSISGASSSFTAAASSLSTYRAQSETAAQSQEKLAAATKKATKSVDDERIELEQLLGQIDPVTRRLGELDKQEQELARHRKSGKIDLDTYNDYQAKLTSTRSALTGFNSDLNKTGMSAKATAAALRGVPAQFTDIATSLQGGQAPLTVFLQQGGQLKDMFGGAGPAAKALGGYVAGLINPFTIAASAVGVFTLAAYKGYEQSEQYRKALTMSGDAAGKTADDLIALSNVIAGGRNFDEASQAVLALAGNGRLTGEAFTEVARAATELSVATGKSAADIADQLSSTKGSVTDLAAEYSDKYGVITLAVFEQVRALEQQGDRMGAIKVLAGAVADEMGARNREMIESTRGLAKAWDDVKTSVSGVWNELKAGLSASPELFKLQHLQGQLQDAQKIGDKALISGLEKQVALAQAAVDAQTQKKEGISAELQERKALVSADEKWHALTKKEMTDQAKLAKDIADARKLGVEAGKSQAEIDKVVADIQAKYNKSQAKPKAYTEDAGTKMLDQARKQYAVLQQQGLLIDNQANGTKAIGTEAKKLVELEQQISDIKTKQTLTADQKSILAMADLNIAQQKRNADLEKEVELRKQAAEEAQKLLTFTQSVNDKLAQDQQGLDNSLAGIGLGAEGRKRLQEDLKIRQDYQKQAQQLQRDYQNGKITKDLYDKETDILQEALASRLVKQEIYYNDVSALQTDWTKGASEAFNNYVNEANNTAKMTESAFSNAFTGIEDVFVSFITTGKASFKEFANSVIADLARVVVKQQIVAPMLKAMSGDSPSGGGIGQASGEMFGGGTGSGFTDMLSMGQKAIGLYNTGAGQAFMSGFQSGTGIVGGIESGLSAGYASLSGAITGNTAAIGSMQAGYTGSAMSNWVAGQAGTGASAASGAATGAASGASAGVSTLGAVGYGIGGAIQGYQAAGLKGAATGAAGAVGGAYGGAALGTMILPGIGTLIGAALGALLGGTVGASIWGGDWQTKDQGLQLGVENNELASSQFEYQKKKGGMFSSNKKRTNLSALDPEMQKALDTTYDATEGSVLTLFDRLNVQLNDGVLDGLNVAATQISTKGKTGEEIQAAITKWFGGVADSMVTAISDSTGADTRGFTFEGLTTFVNNLYTVNDALGNLNVGLFDVSVQGGFMAEQLSAWAGGLESLTKNAGTYYDNFFGETEKADDTLGAVGKQFAAINMVLPSTRQGYRDIIEALDVTTEAGRQMFITLTGLAGNAAAAYTILDKRQSDYYSAFYSESENATRSLDGFNQVFKDAGVSLPPLRAGFRELVEAASRDTTEAGKKMYSTLMGLAGTAGSAYDILESKANNAAEAAKVLANNLVTGAMSAVQRAVAAGQKDATKAYSDRNNALNELASTATESVSGLTSVGNDLSAALKALRGDSDDAVKMLRAQAQVTLQSALATARSGGSLSGFTGLSDALDTVSNNNTDLYSSMEDFARDQGRTANVVAELNAINGVQLTTEQQLLASVQDQIKLAKDQFDDEMLRLDNQLAFAQSQLDALNGIDNSVISVSLAMSGLSAAITAALAAKPAGSAAANTSANNSTLLDAVYQSVLGRDVDKEGAAYWGGLLQSGGIDYAGLVAAITKDAKANGEIPAFANGGFHAGGIRLVGEKGPEIEATGAARYWSASKSADALTTASSGGSSEMAERQAWTNRLLNQLIKAVNKQTNIGMPVWQVNQ